jgi:hypothetical protein
MRSVCYIGVAKEVCFCSYSLVILSQIDDPRSFYPALDDGNSHVCFKVIPVLVKNIGCVVQLGLIIVDFLGALSLTFEEGST